MLAISAIGFNASYGIWLARAGREPEHLGHVLRGIKTLDDLFANPPALSVPARQAGRIRTSAWARRQSRTPMMSIQRAMTVGPIMVSTRETTVGWPVSA